MKVPKEIADKVKAYQEGQKALEEVIEWLRANTDDDVFIEDIFIVDEPTGHEQNDGEYCDQHAVGWCGDSYEGNYYHPIEGSPQYLGYSYSC